MNIEHGKRIVIESFYEGQLASSKEEVEISLYSTKETILKDMIDALSVISSGETHRLNVEVCVDSQGRYRLIKKWVV